MSFERWKFSIDRTPMRLRAPGREPVRVLLIDQSGLALCRFQERLSRSQRVVACGTVYAEEDAVIAVRTRQPEVVIVNGGVRWKSGIRLCKVIRNSWPNIGVVCLIDNDDAQCLRAAILAGARGCLLKTASDLLLEECIVAVSLGNAMIDQRLTHHVLKWIRDGSGAELLPSKTGPSIEGLRPLGHPEAGGANQGLAQGLNVQHSMIMMCSHQSTSGCTYQSALG